MSQFTPWYGKRDTAIYCGEPSVWIGDFRTKDQRDRTLACVNACTSVPNPAAVADAVAALAVILPMAKGYAHEHPVGNNAAIVAGAESALAALSKTMAHASRRAQKQGAP